VNNHPEDLLDEVSLSIIFGEESRGKTPEERANTSPRLWVRSQDHLAIFKPGATGLIMSAREVLNIFGLTKMYEAIDYGTAIIARTEAEPGATLRVRRHELDLDQHEVAEQASLTVEQVRDCESHLTRSDIHHIAAICVALGLDARSIGFLPYRPSTPTA